MPGTESASPLLIYMVKQVELAVRARLDEIVRPAGLTTAQYTALSVLERHTDMSSAQLARSSFVTAQSMADMITALEDRKLIERHRDRTDRRRLVVALTGEGRALLDRCRPEVAALEASMLSGLSGPQTKALRATLAACYANVSHVNHARASGQPGERQCRRAGLSTRPVPRRPLLETAAGWQDAEYGNAADSARVRPPHPAPARRARGRRRRRAAAHLRAVLRPVRPLVGRAAGARRAAGRPGGHIAPNTHAQLESFYAVPQLGAVLVPMNYRLTADDFVYMINHSGATVLCVHSDYLDAVDGIRDQMPGVRHFVALEGVAGRTAGSTTRR